MSLSLNMTLYLCYYLRLNDKTYRRELAEKLNVSQMQVSRRLKKALAAMYEIITSSDYERN